MEFADHADAVALREHVAEHVFGKPVDEPVRLVHVRREQRRHRVPRAGHVLAREGAEALAPEIVKALQDGR